MTLSTTQEPFTIALSQRVDMIEARNEYRDSVDQRLAHWLWRVGGITVQVPNRLQSQGALISWISAINPKALVLSGGNNIGDYPERDATELALLNYAAENKLPVLGICRGMQMMAIAAGARLERVHDHAGTRHKLYVNPGCRDFQLSEVNSFHEWRIKDCPKNYRVIAKSLDGTIEAIHHNSRRWEGWMWHPEREVRFSCLDINRARRLFFES